MRFSILTLCFAPLAVLASGNEFQELQQLLGQFSTLGNSLIVQDSAADLAPAANVCWKEIKLGGGGRKTPESSSSCAVGYELSAGRCYVPCSTGYRGWGPFCISTDANAASRSYQRGNGKAFDAKSNEDKFAVSESCPSALPFQCMYSLMINLKSNTYDHL